MHTQRSLNLIAALTELYLSYRDNPMAKSKPAAKSVGKTVKKTSSKKAAKRELIDTGKDKRYVRRDEHGQFKESDDVGKSLSQDGKQKAKSVAKPGQGDKGDHKPSK